MYVDPKIGSVEKASEHIDELKKFSTQSPFSMSDLASSSQMLQSMGLSVDEVLPSLKMLGDISLGNTEKLSGLALVFSQVKSQGKLMGNDIYQFINNGFNPLQIIAEKTGRLKYINIINLL